MSGSEREALSFFCKHRNPTTTRNPKDHPTTPEMTDLWLNPKPLAARTKRKKDT